MSVVELRGTGDPPVNAAAACSSQSAQNNFAGASTPASDVPASEPRDSTGERSRVASNPERPNALRQQQMSEAYHIAKRKELDGKWASFFYEANVAFNVVRHPSFIAAVRATSLAKFDYEPPSYNAMRTSLIEPARKHVEAEVKKATKHSIELYGATICTDGWDNVTRRPLMNVMLSCPAGDVFLGSIDTTGNKKTKAYIAAELKNFILDIGPRFVTQICTDNAANMLGAMDDIIIEYPHISKQGCAAHALDLMLEDWSKIEQFKDLTMKAKRVCIYMRNHHVTMALFREHSPRKSLVVPADTRFACQFLMISRMVEVRYALEQVVIHPRWTEYVQSLFNRQNGNAAHRLAATVRATVLNRDFWHRCENYVHMVEDVIKALRVFDGREPAMGRAWLTMNNLKKHIFNLRNPPFNLPARIATTLEENFTRRWGMMATDLHYAGALLNPYLKDVLEIQENGDAKRALNRVVRKLCGVLGVRFNDAMAELTEYEERRGPYSPLEAPDIREANMEPHQWWHRVGGNALPKIAKRILSLTCSASSCERNWSMYSFVHSKSRNRLGVDKAEKLVFIYTNSKLLRQRPGADPVRWYENNILSEDSDPDDNGQETDSEGNDDGGNDDDGDGDGDSDSSNDDGMFGPGPLGGEIPGANEPRAEHAPNNNDDGGNGDGFDWEGFEGDGAVGGAHNGNRSPTPSSDGGNRAARSSEDWDDAPSHSNDNHVEDENDDDRNNSVRNRNDEEAPNNGAVGGDAEVGLQEPQNNSTGGLEQVPVQHGPQIDVPEGVDANLVHDTAPEVEGAIDSQDEIPLDEMPLQAIFLPRVHRTPPSVGPTLVSLGNARGGVGRRPPRHRPVLRNNHSTRGRVAQSTIRHPQLPSEGGMACTEQAEGSSRGSRRLNQSNPSILPFLDTHTPGGSSCTPPLGMRRGPEVTDADNPSAKRMKRIVPTTVAGTNNVEVRNLTSEVEGEVQTHYGDEHDVEGDDEREDYDGNVREEAPNDPDIRIRQPTGVDSSTIRRSERLRSSPMPDE